MFQGTIERIGDRYFVEVPRAEVERLGLHEGQTVLLKITDLPTQVVSPGETARTADRTNETHRDP